MIDLILTICFPGPHNRKIVQIPLNHPSEWAISLWNVDWVDEKGGE